MLFLNISVRKYVGIKIDDWKKKNSIAIALDS